MKILYFVLTIDDESEFLEHPQNFNQEWQTALLQLFFEEIPEDGMNDLARKDRVEDYCTDCRCIHCLENVAVRVDLAHFHFGNLNPYALPHTIRSIRLFACKQHFPIHTRSLPRGLRGIGLRENRIYGRIDLTTLPPLLRLANFHHNELCGPIDLTQLPKDLQKLDLSHNDIRQHTVFYDALPENLEFIRFHGPDERRGIRYICALDRDRRHQDKKLFIGIPGKNVH